MNNVLTQLQIDLYSSTSYEVIKAQQGDKNSRVIEFVLYSQGEPYEFSDNIFFRFVGHRGDGSSFSKTEEECIMRNGNHVRVTLPEDVLYYDGTIEAKLVMYELSDTTAKSVASKATDTLPKKPEKTVLSTIPFKISCIKNPCNENNLSEGELSIVTDLIFQMEEFSKNAQGAIDQAQNYATLAQSYAIGGTGNRENEDIDNAKNYCETAEKLKSDAAADAATANKKAADASKSANDASGYATQAQSYALGTGGSRPGEDKDNAKHYYEQAKSYAIGGTGKRENEDIDNAQHYSEEAQNYYEQAKKISESFSGALRPMGTVTFANLPALSNASEGDMYNISDQFTTNANFKEGSELVIPAGSNVYKTADGKWDILAGTPVTGVKGGAEPETAYHTGNVNLTPENIGAVKKSGDTMTGTLSSSKATQTHLAGNKGDAIINSTAAAGAYTMLDKLNSTNGYFTDGVYQNKRLLQYTAKSTVDANTNAVTKSATLLDESGNSQFPGTVTAQTFSGNAIKDGNGNIITDSYAVRKVISSGSFNSVLEPGLYTMRTSSVSDAPPDGGNYHGLIVLKSDTGNFTEQIAFKEGSTNLYVRYYNNNNNKSDWKKLITEDDLLNKTYPIGSIYMSVNSTSPATLFGGTWVRWGNGRIPVGVDTSQTEFNTVGKTGGEKTHTLTEAEMPQHSHTIAAKTVETALNGAHSHTLKYSKTANTNGSGARINGDGTLEAYAMNSSGAHTHNVTIPAHTTDAKGSGTAHNNLPPYITCYMWKRTA